MSIDASVCLYFPVSKSADALVATRRVLRKRRSVLGVRFATPDGEVIRIPASIAVRNRVEVWAPDGMRLIEMPTISPAFPEVMGTEPIFPIKEETRISGLTVEVVRRKAGRVVGAVPVGFSLARGRDCLELSFDSLTSTDVQEFFTPRFRSRIAGILAEGGGSLVVYHMMGEWASFADQRRIEDPGGRAEAAGIDAFVAFLIEQLATAG